ncbi:type IV pilus modification PilV family protein [Dyella caseinilytica]|uniref:Prepilin-type N-terminal cleavage/methylation domain-containing protein n=1 Tax=Dyella caseinilytica TaxID=1849581 RepID=A0ABX7GSC2_9GAMM|nr:prepilin-type N-terminal cleavage/methylation domain-containing protein [Dyella caseinilytica]QRN53286.1 prepilin-type N-terminal cleavage/methylation domain-containing protein [Dyella caseinilytica]
MKTSMRHARGFSLLEVIAAILLLAITFGALMEVAGGSIRLSQSAAQYTQAALWARSLLDTRFALDPLQAGVTEGHFDDHYRWRLQVTPWVAPGVTPAANANAMQMYQLNLDVMWGSEPFEHKAHFSTLRIGSPNNAAPSL